MLLPELFRYHLLSQMLIKNFNSLTIQDPNLLFLPKCHGLEAFLLGLQRKNMYLCECNAHKESWNGAVQVNFILLLVSLAAAFFQVLQSSSGVPVTPPTVPDGWAG